MSSEKGCQTVFAKSPPSSASASTICCPPFIPPFGSGTIRATAITRRITSQPPKPQRPSRAVATVPATVW